MEQYYVLMRILLENRDSKCIEQEIYEVTWETSLILSFWVNLLLQIMLIYFVNFSQEHYSKFLSKI
jgi:hypothetical protein